MDSLFVLLILASFILLIIGFFNPQKSLFWYKQERTGTKSATIYGIALVASFILFGIITDKNKTQSNSSSSDNSQTTTENSSVEKTTLQKEPEIQLTQAQKDSIAQVEKLATYEDRKSQTIQAKDLYNAYQANEVRADNNYKGKNFYVEGVIEDISKDILDDIYVTLKTGDIFGNVQCYIDDANIAAKLQKGQRITVFGECDGLMMNVGMKDCKVVENLSDLK